jgi:hypothetical protein
VAEVPVVAVSLLAMEALVELAVYTVVVEEAVGAAVLLELTETVATVLMD